MKHEWVSDIAGDRYSKKKKNHSDSGYTWF